MSNSATNKDDRKLNVLHVDDDADFLAVFSLIYKKSFNITSTGLASDAMDLLLKNDFDAVVIDFDMPQMNGLELLKKIKGIKPDLSVIFYTGQGNEQVARDAFLLGASDYFVKDIHGFAHREKLVNSIRRAKKIQLAEHARKLGEEKIKHLNNVLRAIRDVNKLITRETNTEKLIIKACEILVENRGFLHAWIILVDENGSFSRFAQAGMEQQSKILDDCFKTEDYKCCFKLMSEKSGVLVIDKQLEQWCNCPLFEILPSCGLMTAMLEYNGEVLGYMAVSIPVDFILDPQEQEIFQEVTGDISYAIYHNRIRREHEKAVEDLRDREEVLNAIAQTARDFIFCKDLESKYTFINPAMAELLGNDAKNLIGRTPAELFGEEDSLLIASVDKPVFEGETVDEIKTLLINNVPRIFHTVQVPLRDKNGGVSGICGVVRDVTEREEARRKLQESEELFSIFMENIPVGIFIKDENSKYIYVNNYLKQHLGADDWIGFNAFKAFPVEVAEKMIEDDRKVLNEGLKVVIDKIPNINGTHHIYRTYKFPVFREGKSRILGGIAVDITDLENVEEKYYNLENESQFLLDNTDVILYRASLEFFPLSFMGNLEKFTGYKEEELVSGKILWKNFVTPESSFSITPVDQANLRSVPGFHCERKYGLIHKDGYIRNVTEKITNICNRAGEVVGIRGMIFLCRAEEADTIKSNHDKVSSSVGYIF